MTRIDCVIGTLTELLPLIGFELAAVRYCYLDEPGHPTIVGPDLTFAGAYATSGFVMGIPGLTWLQDNHPDYAGFLITHDGRALSTPSFDQYRA